MALGPQQVEFTTPGTYEWKVPEGVTSVCVVCVGGGGGGGDANNKSGAGGGGLGWKNNISVNPGQTYTVVVGRGGTSRDSGLDSYFIDDTICAGRGGQWSTTGGAGGSYVGDGGGNGGAGASTSDYSGGGGAGGYSGNGGAGATGRNSRGSSGSGGGGGGGGTYWAGSGGGVGLLRQGINGVGGDGSANIATNGGYGGSGGQHGSRYSANTPEENQASEGGGLYGGGGGSNQTVARRAGGSGAVRIIWGTGRAFPSTNTEDLFIESALQDSDIFLVTKADGSESRHIRADKLFSGIADDWLVLINEGGVSKRCLVRELVYKDRDDRYMLVNSFPEGVTTGGRTTSYKIKSSTVVDKYGVPPITTPWGDFKASEYTAGSMTWPDVSGNGNDLTFNNINNLSKPSSSEMRFNKGAWAYKSIGKNIPVRSQYAFEAWIKSSSVDGARVICQLCNSTALSNSLYSYQFYVQKNGSRYLTGIYNTGVDTVSTFTNNNYLNNYHHVIGLYDGTRLRIYENGILRVSKTTSGDSQSLNTFKVAGTNTNGWPDNTDNRGYGAYDIQRLRVWFEYSLTDEEIKACYRQFLKEN